MTRTRGGHFAANGTWLQCGRFADGMTALEWHPPNAPLRASVLRASVFALLVVAGIAWPLRPWLQLGALYPGKAAAMFAAGMAIAFGYVGAHHPLRAVRSGQLRHHDPRHDSGVDCESDRRAC